MTRTGSDSRLSPMPGDPGWLTAWPRYLDPPLSGERTSLIVGTTLVIAACFDLAVRSGVFVVSGSLCVALACAALAASGRVRNPQAVALLAIAPAFGLWMAFRASPWLVVPDALAVCGLVALAASLASGGSLWDMPVSRLIARGAQAALQALLGVPFLVPRRRESTRRFAGVIRGIAIALPVVGVLGVLLASADAVFASFVRFEASDLIAHAALIAVGGVAMAGLFRLASVSHVDVPEVSFPRLASQESTVVLVALNALLGAFAVARVIALTEGGQRVIRSAGLTYAEYARSGFFQLLAAALIAVVVIGALRGSVDVPTRSSLIFRSLALGVVALTLTLVVSAFHRLVLYEAAYGLTMLRIYAQTAIVWVGVVLVLIGFTIAGRSDRTWVWSASGVVALVLLFAMNIFNPEAFVVRHNVEHQRRTARADVSYVSELHADAIPELARTPELKGFVCAEPPDPARGWAAYNVSRARARSVALEMCPPRGG